MMFGEHTIPPSARGNSAFGIMPSAIKSFEDLKSIIYGQKDLSMQATVQYSLLVTFAQPSVEIVKDTVKALQDPSHHFHYLAKIPIIDQASFWAEMRVATASGHRLANLVMPAGMAEAAATKQPECDLNFLILGQALSWHYESSRKNLGVYDMRCVIPVAEIRVRDIYRFVPQSQARYQDF